MGVVFSNFESLWHFLLSGQFGITDIFKIFFPLQKGLPEQLEGQTICLLTMFS